jgi:hypothetical protein
MNKQSFITLLFTIFFSVFVAKAFAHDIEVTNTEGVTIYYTWEKNNTELSVSCRGSYYHDYTEYSGNVVIPSSVDYNGKTYYVTSIDDGAFQFCTTLTSVTIPSSVTNIGADAFNNCQRLTSVTIPNSVKNIDSRAFKDCI